MIWDNKNKAFRNKANFGLGNILDNPINDFLDGYIIFEKRHSNSGDGMSILINSFDSQEFWFKYQSNAMWTYSYDDDFKSSVGIGRIKLEGSKFNYSLKDESTFERERKQLQKKY